MKRISIIEMNDGISNSGKGGKMTGKGKLRDVFLKNECIINMIF